MKRLIVCADGTWNTATQPCPTNVEKLSSAIAARAADGCEQRTYYHPGVGTRRWERISGGAFGYGLGRNVRDCYRFFVENYELGDELYLFGFSRGAFTARSTAGLIRNAGILTRDHLDLIGDAYALYRDNQGPDADEAMAFRRSYAWSVVTPIRFIGVWDTVGALGIPNFGMPWTNWLNRRYQFHDTQLSSRVRYGYQALAIDEARRPFTPTLWQSDPDAVDQHVEQVWFAGVHCDVGGGYREGELSDVTWHWMADRARDSGLAFSEPSTPLDPDFCFGMLHDSRAGLYRLLPPYIRPVGRADPTSEFVASTAVERAKRDGYRAANLTAYLQGPNQQLPI